MPKGSKPSAESGNGPGANKSPEWTAGNGEFSQKPNGTVTNVEHPDGKYDGNSLPYKGNNVGKGTSSNISENVAFSSKQLDKKFKHAGDFGVVTTKKNNETIAQYQAAIKSHLDNKTTYEHGTYLLVPESKVFFNPKTNNVVVIDKSGGFVSGWKLDPTTKQYENFIKNGTLR